MSYSRPDGWGALVYLSKSLPRYAPGREYLEGHSRRPDTFISCTNCPQSLPNTDPLGKGLGNTNQFVPGPNPTNPPSVFRILSVVPRCRNFMVAM